MNAGGRIVILTGPRQAGKTSLCRRLVEAARQQNWRVAGLLSPGRFEAGQKVAIEVEDLLGGERMLLARLPQGEAPETHPLAGWVFDEAALAWGDAILQQAPICDLLVVDELGPLELELGLGWLSGIALLSRGNFQLALVVVRPGLLTPALRLWPEAQIVEVGACRDLATLAGTMAREFFSGPARIIC